MNTDQLAVLFVCLGNICRSPTAQGVFERRLADSALAGRVHVDSAGTAAYHIGNPPDPRSISTAKAKGYELAHLRARQLSPEDFDRFDFILAMDESNLAHLNGMKPLGCRAEVRLFLHFDADNSHREVPDPYYNGEDSFELVVALVERASDGLIDHLQTLNND